MMNRQPEKKPGRENGGLYRFLHGEDDIIKAYHFKFLRQFGDKVTGGA